MKILFNLMLSFCLPLFLSAQLSIQKTSTKPAIDGIIDEPIWNLNYQIASNPDNSNNTAVFGILWDENYLYLAIKVTDDILSMNGRQGWYDDGVEIYIDGQNNKTSTTDANDRLFIKVVNSYWLQEKELRTENVIHQYVPTLNGYSMEFSIPWSNLNVYPGNDTQLGFNIVVNDDDDSSYVYNTPQKLLWTESADYFQNPSKWGTLILSSDLIQNNEQFLAITYPNGGEFLIQNSTNIIQWESVNISTINIDLSTDDGMTWQTIANNVDAASGQFSWETIQTASEKSKVRIQESTVGEVFDISYAEFTISAPLSPVKPLLKDQWKNYQFPYDAYYPNGSNGKASNACGPSSLARIIHFWQFPRKGNGGLSFTDNGGYFWHANFEGTIYNFDNMPNNLSASSTPDEYDDVARLFFHTATSMNDIYGTGTDLANMSHALSYYFNFKESKPCVRNFYSQAEWIKILMNELDNGRVLLVQGMELVTYGKWHQGNSISGHWDHIDGYNEKGEFHVVVGFGDYDGYYDVDKLAIYSFNNGILTNLEPNLQGKSISLSSPLAYQFVIANAETEITWESENIDIVDLEYTIDNGKNWTLIAQNIQASHKKYIWQVPGITSTECKLRITDSSNINVYDKSDSSFIVGNYTLSLISPIGHNFLIEGSKAKITWESTPIASINIDFSNDNGASWNEVAKNIDASVLIYEWVVPEIESSSCKIRISDATNPAIFDETNAPFSIGKGNLFGGPYKNDENTILLMHFENDLINQSGLTDDGSGSNYQFGENSLSQMGNALKPSSAITVNHNDHLNLLADWTIEAWVKITAFNAAPSFIVNKPGDSDAYFSNFSLQNNVYWNNDWFFFYFAGSDRIGVQATKPELNIWYHVAFIRDTEKQKLTLMIHDENWKQVANQSININTDQPMINSKDLVIGDGFIGYIDEVRISNCVRLLEPEPAPDKPSNPVPAINAKNVPINTKLNWTLSSNTSTYDLLFGEENSPIDLLVENAKVANTYSLSELDYSTTYYWKIVARNESGETESEVWSFETEEKTAIPLINKNTNELQITVNDCKSEIHIKCTVVGNLIIINNLGQRIYQQKNFNKGRISLLNFRNGIYFIQLSTNNGSLTQKFILTN